MSVTWSFEKKEIEINEKNSIIIESKGEEGYTWDEVTFKSEEGEVSIGAYYTYNYSSSREWMEYNSNYIVLLSIYMDGYEPCDTEIKKLFDVNSRRFIEGSQEELFEYYNQEFKQNNKKKVLTEK